MSNTFGLRLCKAFIVYLSIFFFQLEHLLWNATEHQQECSVVNHTQTCTHISWSKKMG